MSHLGVIVNKRFSGIFWTQFIGAFTDNLFKNALTVLVMFHGWKLGELKGESVNYLAGALFIFPFFLFSATAGQLADKLEKTQIIRSLKLIEIVFSGLAFLGLYLHNVTILMTVLIFFALQATFFGPIKYGILPQLLEDDELVAGNALVETATNMAILLGTIIAGVMVERYEPVFLGGFLVAISVLGWLMSKTIPLSPSKAPELVVEWNPFPPTWKILQLVAENRAVFNSVLGISWFWLLGGSIIGFFPVYVEEVLHGDGTVLTLLLTVFSVGVGVGSIWCEKVSQGRLELGLVPIGSIGVSLFCLHIFWLGSPWSAGVDPVHYTDVLNRSGGLWILIDLFGLSTASGFFIVPLYTLIQKRSRPEVRSRIIAGNNILNALFMVGSYVALAGLRSKGLSLPQLFGLLGVLNAGVAIYIYTLIPEFTLRFISFLITHFLYRVRVKGLKNIPDEGALVLVANHVSLVDWLVLLAAVNRPIRFVMWYTYYQMPVAHYLFRDAGAIPISNSHIRPKIMQRAFERIREVLEDGEVLGIFPEGRLSKDGEMTTFRPGIEKIVQTNPVPVVPIAIKGLWGGNFSRFKGGFLKRFWTRPLRSKIQVIVGEPIPPDQVTAAALQERVAQLLQEEC